MDFKIFKEDEGKGEGFILELEAERKGRKSGQGAGEPCQISISVTFDECPPRIILRSTDKSGVGTLAAVLTEENAQELANSLECVVAHLRSTNGEPIKGPLS